MNLLHLIIHIKFQPVEFTFKPVMEIPQLMVKVYRHHAGCAALALKKQK
jgi:hypothetical protein